MNVNGHLSSTEGQQSRHPLVELARAAVETYVRTGRRVSLRSLPQEWQQQRAGAFVSIKTVDGELRGCIGTVVPTQKHLALEVVYNAIAAASRDPRFLPVRMDELPGLSYSVDIIGPLEPVSNLGELDPKLYGVMVINGLRHGVLLPDIAGVDTVEQQLAIARSKAFILPGDPAEIYRFQVQRYG